MAVHVARVEEIYGLKSIVEETSLERKQYEDTYDEQMK
jgi:hypothetical protein